MTARKRIEAASERSSRFYRMMCRLNSVVLRAKSHAEMIESLSIVLSESDVFSALVIALESTDGKLPKTDLCYCQRNNPGCFAASVLRGMTLPSEGPGPESMLVLNDLAGAASSHPWLEKSIAAGHAALASLRFGQRAGPSGRLLVMAAECNFFTDDSVVLLQELADGFGLRLSGFADAGLDSAYQQGVKESRREMRELLKHLHLAREDERSLIMRELHDELGQTLSALKIDVIGMEKKIPPTDSSSAESFARMKTLIVQAMEETRRIVAAQRPRVLDDMGLAMAVEWLANDFSTRMNIPCHRQIDLPGEPYPEIVSTTVFRCVQECLTNIMRHADAGSVTLSLWEQGHDLKLCITDDGRGMSARGPGKSSRFGLLGLRQRAEALGGTFEIVSGINRGTTIKIALPALANHRHTATNELGRLPRTVPEKMSRMELRK